MKGYAYLDLDRNIVYKVADYIDNENPGFFSQNAHLIVKHWKFDTEDPRSMLRMFTSINDFAVPAPNVNIFIKSIKYDMNNLRNASKV